ncbi:hypothetical protein ACFL34_03285 [Candidatus Sumerlaeota bacterium]
MGEYSQLTGRRRIINFVGGIIIGVFLIVIGGLDFLGGYDNPNKLYNLSWAAASVFGGIGVLAIVAFGFNKRTKYTDVFDYTSTDPWIIRSRRLILALFLLAGCSYGVREALQITERPFSSGGLLTIQALSLLTTFGAVALVAILLFWPKLMLRMLKKHLVYRLRRLNIHPPVAGDENEERSRQKE